MTDEVVLETVIQYRQGIREQFGLEIVVSTLASVMVPNVPVHLAYVATCEA